MHCCFFQEPILKIWLQIVVKAGAINFDALHQLLYLLFSLVSTICVLLYGNKINTRMLVIIGICFKLYFDTRHFVFCNLSPSRMFLSLDILPKYRIQHTIGLLYVTSIYSTRIFYRGVSGFATDWCAILIAHQIVMAKHGGSCVHFSGISTCGRTSRETVSHPQCPPLPTLCKISLPIYVIVTNKLLQPLTTTWYDSLVLSFSLLKM